MGNQAKEIVRSIYSCDAKILQYGQEIEKVTEVLSSHMKGQSNLSVKLLNIEKQSYGKIPKGITDFFPNLEGLLVQDCELRNISRSDLKTFPKIKYLTLMGNQIDHLDNDLFSSTPNLVFINLAWNLIKSIGADVFTSLRYLQSVSLYRNPCTSAEVWKGTADQLKTFRNEVLLKCK